MEIYRDIFERSGIRDWWSLPFLLTDIGYSHSGVDEMIIRWGCDAADRDYVLSTCEVAVPTMPIYEAAGFELRAIKTVKVAGEEEELTFAIMTRNPREFLFS